MRGGSAALRVAVHSALVVASFFTLIPLVWLVCAAFKHQSDMFSFTFVAHGTTVGGKWQNDPVDPSLIKIKKIEKDGKTVEKKFVVQDGKEVEVVEHGPTTNNFNLLFTTAEFRRYLLNSFFLTSTATSVSLILASLGGFALAKYHFRAKTVLLGIMLGVMMIPGSVLLAPSYELLCQLGLMNSYAGILIPGAVGAFGMLLFRQAMLHVPDDLLEAARIDGCSELRIYWNVVMPVVRPMTGAFCLLSFMGHWNSFLWPMIVLQSEGLFTVPIFLSSTMGQTGDNQYGLLMAGTFLGILPPAALFFLLQKEFIAGLTAGAVKG